MDEKLKSENIQKRAVFGISELIIMFMLYFERNLGKRRYTDHMFIQIYFRMHHFVVKFSKFSSLLAAMGH